MIIALLTSLGIVLAASSFPALYVQTREMIHSVDFYTILMEIMLTFLIFAGSIHIRLNDIKSERVPNIAFSTIGVLLSIFIVGGLKYLLFQTFHLNIPFINSLLFGALIFPTDPIAVMGILKTANIPKSLETKIAGEILFNEGVCWRSGIRGGISVALALALPRESSGDMFLTVTYIIALFSIIFQGLTIGKLAKKLTTKSDNKSQ